MDHTEIAARLSELTRKVAAGNAAEVQRKDLLRAAYAQNPVYWTQTRLAAEAGISQAAVSKIVNQAAGSEESPFPSNDKPGFLLGRLLGVASWVEGRLFARRINPTWEGALDKVLEMTTPPTALQIQQIKAGALRDLQHLPEDQQELARDVFADIEAAATEPLGPVRLSQQERMWFVLGVDAQKHALNEASA